MGSNPATPTDPLTRVGSGYGAAPRFGGSADDTLAAVLHLRISSPTHLTEGVVAVLERAPAVSSLAVLDGASRRPPGDVVLADVAREAANDILDELLELGVQREGTLQIEPVDTWVSQPRVRRRAPRPGQQRGRRGAGSTSRGARTPTRSSTGPT